MVMEKSPYWPYGVITNFIDLYWRDAEWLSDQYLSYSFYSVLFFFFFFWYYKLQGERELCFCVVNCDVECSWIGWKIIGWMVSSDFQIVIIGWKNIGSDNELILSWWVRCWAVLIIFLPLSFSAICILLISLKCLFLNAHVLQCHLMHLTKG
jgi:hypothetical protein